MLPGWALLLVSVGYAALLFGVAWLGDRQPLYPRQPLAAAAGLQPGAGGVLLVVDVLRRGRHRRARRAWATCRSTSARCCSLLFGWRILERLVLIAQRRARCRSPTSSAPATAARSGLAALVAVIALIAAVPYLALQFKAVAISLDVLGGRSAAAPSVWGDPALYVAALLALFAILFGTRQVDATEHHHGLMLAVALESLVKLLAFVAIGVFALCLAGTRAAIRWARPTRAAGATARRRSASWRRPCWRSPPSSACRASSTWRWSSAPTSADLRRARWLFGGYLVADQR